MVDLQSQYALIRPQVEAGMEKVLSSAQFINGPAVKSFQSNLESYLSVKHVIPCANGTDALQVAMMGLGLEQLAEAIRQTSFRKPSCPIYQNVTAQATQDIDNIKDNLIAQLTGPVRWTQSIEAMRKEGATQFVECGPGKVLQGLVRKIDNEVHVQAALG